MLRFINGHMRYWMRGFDTAAMVETYVEANRSVWVQELALTPAQRVALRDFLEWNERPEHRFYRYDYYRDNCATRVRDALDRVLHGRIRALTDTIPTGTTYRFHTARLTAYDLPLYTGLILALGEPADREISAWEEMFLPLELQDWMRHVTVGNEEGTEVPLVRSERALFVGTEPPPHAAPPGWIPGYLAAGLAIALSLWGLAWRGAASSRARHGFAWLAGAWALLGGLAGGILSLMWALTDHAMVYHNENLLQASPLLLPLAALAPAVARGAAWAKRPAVTLARLAAAGSVAGLAIKLASGVGQHNAEILVLVVPANLGLVAGFAALNRGFGGRGAGVAAATWTKGDAHGVSR